MTGFSEARPGILGFDTFSSWMRQQLWPSLDGPNLSDRPQILTEDSSRCVLTALKISQKKYFLFSKFEILKVSASREEKTSKFKMSRRTTRFLYKLNKIENRRYPISQSCDGVWGWYSTISKYSWVLQILKRWATNSHDKWLNVRLVIFWITFASFPLQITMGMTTKYQVMRPQLSRSRIFSEIFFYNS